MEDIDAAFHQTLSREFSGEGEEPQQPNGLGPPANSQARTSKISLSGLLNALDGVGAQEGRLLFATTNRYEALDPALRRPGRMDVHVEFRLASRCQVGELFKRFYFPTPRTSPATTRLPSSEDADRKVSDSGYTTPTETEPEKLIDIELPPAQDRSLAAVSRRRGRDVKISLDELDILMARFRESIPEREFSMAALQGYLLLHKNQPYRAVECAGNWVEEETAKRETSNSSEGKDQ